VERFFAWLGNFRRLLIRHGAQVLALDFGALLL
jgi:hypothetical protein